MAETQHNRYTHGLSTVAFPAAKSHVVSTKVSLSPGSGEFSVRNSGFGVKSELFSLHFVGPKRHGEGSWAGTRGALSSPNQGLVSQHPLGLACPWRADEAERLARCASPTQPAADLNGVSQSRRQIQADNETRLIGAQNCYWRRGLLFFPPPPPKEFFH